MRAMPRILRVRSRVEWHVDQTVRGGLLRSSQAVQQQQQPLVVLSFRVVKHRFERSNHPSQLHYVRSVVACR